MSINLALYSETSGQSISTTEYSLPNKSTTLTPKTDIGSFQLILDCANMVAGDAYELLIKEKVVSGGTQRTLYRKTVVGAQSEPIVTPPLLLGYGWDYTWKRTAGADRSFTWTLRAVQ